jgi:hypothetical protein
MPYAQVTGTGGGCGSVHDGWADVLELERDDAGAVTRFAASVHSHCAQNPMPDFVHTEVRFHSTIGYHGVDISPMPPLAWPTSHPALEFGRVGVGEQSATEPITISNTGTLSLDVDVVRRRGVRRSLTRPTACARGSG